MEDPIEQVRREMREQRERLAAAQREHHPRDYRCEHGGDPMRCVACESIRERGRATKYQAQR